MTVLESNKAASDVEAPAWPRAGLLRTPESRFAEIEDWPYPPCYINTLPGFDGLRLHYVDIGLKTARRTVLCVHGQKTWGYAFRRAVPFFEDRGYRVIVPDLFGFGRSDKPEKGETYTFQFHRNALLALIKILDLEDLTLCGFDWGGWISATIAMEIPTRVEALLLGNMALHTPDEDIWPGFHIWLSMHNAQLDPAVGKDLGTMNPSLEEAAVRAYDAPFPDHQYKTGIRRFPNLIPLQEAHDTAAVTAKAKAWLKHEWSGRSVLVCGTDDEILGLPTMLKLRQSMAGTPHLIKVPGTGALVFENAPSFMDEALAALA